jgi:hypothetical protein
MKRINIPEIVINSYDRIWLEKVYDIIKSDKKPNYKHMRVELHNSLPNNFNPKNIDIRLLNAYGEEITLLGILIIEPDSKILEKCNTVINRIREVLKMNPEKIKFDLAEIAASINIPISEVGLIFKLICPCGSFIRQASTSSEHSGYTEIDISNDNYIFDEYMNFTNIEDLINKHYLEESKKVKEEQKEKETEAKEMNNKIDDILDRLTKMGYGQEIIFDEIQELKELHPKLNKKNWKQIIMGKLGEVIISKGVEYIGKDFINDIYQTLTNASHKLLK